MGDVYNNLQRPDPFQLFYSWENPSSSLGAQLPREVLLNPSASDRNVTACHQPRWEQGEGAVSSTFMDHSGQRSSGIAECQGQILPGHFDGAKVTDLSQQHTLATAAEIATTTAGLSTEPWAISATTSNDHLPCSLQAGLEAENVSPTAPEVSLLHGGSPSHWAMDLYASTFNTTEGLAQSAPLCSPSPGSWSLPCLSDLDEQLLAGNHTVQLESFATGAAIGGDCNESAHNAHLMQEMTFDGLRPTSSATHQANPPDTKPATLLGCSPTDTQDNDMRADCLHPEHCLTLVEPSYGSDPKSVLFPAVAHQSHVVEVPQTAAECVPRIVSHKSARAGNASCPNQVLPRPCVMPNTDALPTANNCKSGPVTTEAQLSSIQQDTGAPLSNMEWCLETGDNLSLDDILADLGIALCSPTSPSSLLQPECNPLSSPLGTLGSSPGTKAGPKLCCSTPVDLQEGGDPGTAVLGHGERACIRGLEKQFIAAMENGATGGFKNLGWQNCMAENNTENMVAVDATNSQHGRAARRARARNSARCGKENSSPTILKTSRRNLKAGRPPTHELMQKQQINTTKGCSAGAPLPAIEGL